jgi:hypothetical protein
MRRILVLLFVLFATSAHAAVTFDDITSADVDALAQATFNHTVDGGCTTPIIIVTAVWYSSTTALTGVTVEGAPAIFVSGATNTDATRRVEMWRLTGVATGVNEIVIDWGGLASGVAAASSYCGVHQTVPLGTPATATGVTTTPTVAVTSAADELVIDALGTGGTATAAVHVSQTERLSLSNLIPGVALLGASEEAGAASVTMSWTLSETDYWAIVGVALKPTSAVATNVPRRVILIE